MRAFRRTIQLPQPPVPPKQLDLFPVKPVVELLDPRIVVGSRTAVEQVVRVRFHAKDTPHLVFHDRHGWYCETHGPTCESVQVAQSHVRK